MSHKYWTIICILYGVLRLVRSLHDFTEHEQELLLKSWITIGKCPTGSGMELLQLFFGKYPDYLKGFSFKDIPLDELSKDEEYRKHARRTVLKFSKLVNLIKDPPELLKRANKIGADHVQTGIREQAFRDLEDTMIDMVGKKYNDKLKKLWTRYWTVIFDEMSNGLNGKPPPPTKQLK